MNTLRLQKPKNIRFPVELDNRIEQLSQRYRVSKSDLIRQALAHQIPIWEQSGIKLMPIMQEQAVSLLQWPLVSRNHHRNRRQDSHHPRPGWSCFTMKIFTFHPSRFTLHPSRRSRACAAPSFPLLGGARPALHSSWSVGGGGFFTLHVSRFTASLLFLLTFHVSLFTASAALSISSGVASNITRLSADLPCTIAGTNGSGTNPVLTIFYGTTDFTTNAAAWSHFNVFGQSGLGSISTNIAGLTPAHLYYFRWSALETTNIAWSATSNFWTLAGAPTNQPTNPPTGVIPLQTYLDGLLAAPTNFFMRNLALILAAGIASTGDVYAVSTNLAAHVASTNNPHAVTPGQIGAAGTGALDAVSTRVDVAEGNISTNATNIASHVASTNNPHAVTASQIGAVTTNDQTYLSILSTMSNFTAVASSSNWLAYDPITRTLSGCISNFPTPDQIGAAGTNDVAVLQGSLSDLSNRVVVLEGGSIVKYPGDSPTVAGKVYQWASNEVWIAAVCTNESLCSRLLGVAIGTNSTTAGMLLQGSLIVPAVPPVGLSYGAYAS